MTNLWKASTFVLAGALALVVGRGAVVASADAEPQPAMQKALEHLEHAARALESATHDKGGHRAKALEAVKIAVGEVKEGIKFDDANKGEKAKDPKPTQPAPVDPPKDETAKPKTKRVENPK